MSRFTLGLIAAAILAGCARTTPAPPPAAAPAAPVQTVPQTLEAAEAVRLAGDEKLWETALQQIARGADPILARRALARLGTFYTERGRLTEARAALRESVALRDAIRPFLLVRLASVEQRLGMNEEAAAHAAEVIRDSPGTSARSSALILSIATAAAGGSPAAVNTALDATGWIPVDEKSEREFAAAADALDAAGFGTQAGALRMRLLTEYPSGRLVEQTWSRIAAAAPSPLDALDFSGSVRLAERLARANRYDQALDLLDRIQTRYPARKNTAFYRYVRAQSYFNSRNYDRVVVETPAPDQPYYLAIELLRARAYWRSGENENFVTILERIIVAHPKSDEATAAKLLLGKYYVTDAIDYPKAIANYREAITAGGAGSEGEHLWTLGWIQVLAGDHDAALSTLHEYVKKYPDADYTSNALFWSGKVELRRGNGTAARAHFDRLIAFYPYSYFSYRAREIIGLPLIPAEPPAGSAPFPDVSLALSPETETRLVTIDELVATGLRAEAAQELKSYMAAKPDDVALAYRLADYYAQAGEPLKAMGLLQRHFRDVIRHGAAGVPARFWEILYPRPYWEAFVREGARQGIEPYRLAAITRQESGFEPTVVSSAGAVGLMQIMPAEAARIASAGGVTKPVTREALFDPETNIAVGAAEVAQKLRVTNGNLVHAIAAYNAGEEAVGRWLAQSATSDVDQFIESIPFAETRLYVKNVTRNFFEYSRIYGKSATEVPR
ncbi:MAG: transglycosylase SLT domain-containing protein [Thermoanaerobaculia bacterium]